MRKLNIKFLLSISVWLIAYSVGAGGAKIHDKSRYTYPKNEYINMLYKLVQSAKPARRDEESLPFIKSVYK